MRNAKDNNSCLFGEQLVSYIYDELPAAGRSAFEEHLLNCNGCTNEFAAVSMSRLGVYEWHRDDFLPLETPSFAIPYERPLVAVESKVSWVDTLRGLFAPSRLAAAGGAFAVLVIAFGFIAFYTTNDGPAIADAGANAAPSVERAVEPPSVPVTPEQPKVIVVANAQPIPKAEKAVQAKAVKREVKRPTVIQAAAPQKAPRLGTYDDAEDTSLRLADLVADIDTDDF